MWCHLRIYCYRDGGEEFKEVEKAVRELGEIHAHTSRHGAPPTGNKLKEIQVAVKAESQLLEIKMQQDQHVLLRREQVLKHGARM